MGFVASQLNGDIAIGFTSHIPFTSIISFWYGYTASGWCFSQVAGMPPLRVAFFVLGLQFNSMVLCKVAGVPPLWVAFRPWASHDVFARWPACHPQGLHFRPWASRAYGC